MNFLPIAQRELRVASRRKTTHYVRGAATLVGTAIGFFYMLMSGLSGGSSFAFGPYLFTVLSNYALLTALLAGVFLASDSLSEERREGTLGLLFLTDLRGYDVVLGKFAAVSLNAFYGLLAVFPVLALCLLTGGVAGAEFWRTCLGLINLLFFAAAAGMLVSSFSKFTHRAMLGTIAFLAMLLLMTLVASACGLEYLETWSAFEPYILASDAEYLRRAREYWASLAFSHITGWLLLGWAGWRLTHFVDKSGGGGSALPVSAGNQTSRCSARRARLLNVNPVLWLLDDAKALRWAVWVLALAAVLMILSSASRGPVVIFILGYTTWPFYFLLKVLFAIQACRFFVEARRTGALELLCCTPLRMREIVAGQWMLLRRVFMWPVIILLGVHLAVLVYAGSAERHLMGGANAPNIGNYFYLYYTFKVIPNTVADFVAIGFFGMWLAVSMKAPKMAAGLTILAVVILPTIAICVPTLAIDAIFIVVGSVKLSEDFRLRQRRWI